MVHPYIGGYQSDVWLPRYIPMGADVGVFQVADTPAYGYVYSIPLKGRVFSKTLVKGDCNTVDQPSKSKI